MIIIVKFLYYLSCLKILKLFNNNNCIHINYNNMTVMMKEQLIIKKVMKIQTNK